MEPVKHLNCSLFKKKKKNSLQPKTISAKNPPKMFERVLKNTKLYFDESYPKY